MKKVLCLIVDSSRNSQGKIRKRRHQIEIIESFVKKE
jgi:hypothetical protein